ncbi:MAG: DUF371 domain-containing protein [Candidatus Bathyarchaeota archaeon]|nr:MAG: DUF371 domain-containing protein [Candidatus Bathyarchaeota archaeon]
MKAVEIIKAFGHRNILATHCTTFEITTDEFVTRSGDCLIAVGSSKSLRDLDSEFVQILRTSGSKLRLTIQTDNAVEQIEARGSPRLTLNHPTDLVIRRSDYVCDRTLAIKSNKAAEDFSRSFVRKLQIPMQQVQIILAVEH